MTIEGTVVHCPLEWDSVMLGIPCGRVDFPDSEEDGTVLAEHILGVIPTDERLTLIKVPATHPAALAGLVRAGATRIGDEVTLEYGGPAPSAATAVETRIGTSWEGEEFLALAETLEHSRFFLDGGIPRERAVALWRESIRNHCRGRADVVVTGHVDGEPAGLIAGLDAGGTLMLFLVGVLPRFQRRGVGLAMLRAVTEAARGPVAVEALRSNRGAVALYEKAGFRAGSLCHVLHRWRDGS